VIAELLTELKCKKKVQRRKATQEDYRDISSVQREELRKSKLSWS